jgi:hypothetical protein
MKTLKKADDIKRVENKNVSDMIKSGWTYITKKEWKEEVKEIKSKKYSTKNI